MKIESEHYLHVKIFKPQIPVAEHMKFENQHCLPVNIISAYEILKSNFLTR